ncbi:nucleoside 2-deoxyribosyltransferase [Massilibacteroides sp.]|uniref:nucleoside 2-deoxyribosyltransferase n=1 Tax=Massilibacteroides sp. TaxID=2034766 RepID=UPI002627D2D8|nr:nucleoside 2-deoxyribosyltransferase [Massilibacteroides sp.]MDD4515686.1 nucleoside 2-deoxyribosyltransferase [Massilibacteroides sp.]
MKKVFIICSVRGASNEYRKKLETYVSELEKNGIMVHLPHRDTNQNARGYDICTENANAIKESDEVHIFYNSTSQGTHFDMGVSFALGKKVIIVENEKYGEGKSYPKMLDEWQNKNKN